MPGDPRHPPGCAIRAATLVLLTGHTHAGAQAFSRVRGYADDVLAPHEPPV